MDKNTALKMLDGYRNRVADQELIIKELTEDLQQCRKELDSNMALIAAIVKDAGQVTANREDIILALRGELTVKIGYDDATSTYTLKTAEE